MQPDGDGSGVTTAAKEQAGQVGRTAADAGGTVAQTTKEQAQNVVGEAKQQARDLVGEARTQVGTQAGTQKSRAVEQLRTLGSELDGMAQQGGQSGLATEVARQVAQRTQTLADHLDRHEPAELLDQFRSFARRRPMAFLAGAALAGVVAGRLTKSLASSDEGADRRALSGGYPAQTYPTPTYTEPVVAGPGPAYVGDTTYVEPGYVAPGYEPSYQEPGYPAGSGRTP